MDGGRVNIKQDIFAQAKIAKEILKDVRKNLLKLKDSKRIDDICKIGIFSIDCQIARLSTCDKALTKFVAGAIR